MLKLSHTSKSFSLLGLAASLLMGCGQRSPSRSLQADHHQVSRGPVTPTAYATQPQRSMLTLDPAPATTAIPAD
ncbi:MAG TPA: hypothetical protein VMU50_16450, partial [Polyangia bacterium]|nr:hypothetical protein [Polyangia bacterium]